MTRSYTPSYTAAMSEVSRERGATEGGDTRRTAAATRRRLREKQILEATRALFDERGVRDVNIDDIARLVGTNRAILYRTSPARRSCSRSRWSATSTSSGNGSTPPAPASTTRQTGWPRWSVRSSTSGWSTPPSSTARRP